jgi:hypothetical protein
MEGMIIEELNYRTASSGYLEGIMSFALKSGDSSKTSSVAE